MVRKAIIVAERVCLQHYICKYVNLALQSFPLISQRQTTLQSTEDNIVGDGGEATTTFVSKNCSTSGWCVHMYYSPPLLPHLSLLPFLLPASLFLPSPSSISFLFLLPPCSPSLPPSPFPSSPHQTTSNADTLFADMKERRQKRRGQVNKKQESFGC